MKTTIDLPDGLFERLKALAASQGTSMREIIVDGLTAEIERRTSSGQTPEFFFPTVGGSGIDPGLDPASVIALSYGIPATDGPA